MSRAATTNQLDVRSTVSGRAGVWAYIGTFLISFAILSFEVSTVRTINFVVGAGFVYFSIAIAMLGLSVAGSVLSCLACDQWRVRRDLVLFWACIITAVLIVICHVAAADIKLQLNEIVSTAGRAGGLKQILQLHGPASYSSVLKIGALMSLPYFMFGALIAYFFANSSSRDYARLYAVDLVGAASGAVCVIIVMEMTDYAISVTVPAIAALLAGVAYVMPLGRKWSIPGAASAVILTAVMGSSWYSDRIEPKADPNYLFRDYDYKASVKEVWHGWNSFTRVGTIERLDGQRNAVLSLNNGDGRATIPPYVEKRAEVWRYGAVVPVLFLDPPDEVLVLFAGSGADLMSLYEHGAGEVVGLEINKLMVEGGKAYAKNNVAEFLAKDNVELNVQEGRVYLEQNSRKFDVIVYSWSGATVAYYAGAIGPTTQYLYTYEGFSAVFDHLKPNGYTLIQNINKVKALAAISRYQKSQGFENAAQTSIVLFKTNKQFVKWDSFWDENPLLFKPSGWSDKEVSRIIDAARKDGYHVAYAPGMKTHLDYEVYERVLKADDVDVELARIRSETNLRFDIVSDNRPFHFDLIQNNLYLSSSFWLALVGIGTDEFSQQLVSQSPAHEFHFHRVKFVFDLSVAALLLTLIPLLVRGDARRAVKARSFHIYFFCLGTGFMFLEITLMQKASLLFGNPGIAIALILGSMIFFTGIGSLASNSLFQRGLSITSASVMVVAYVIFLIFALDFLLGVSLGWSLLGKGLFIFAIVAPAAFFMGQLFPQGIALAAQDDVALVPWAWGVNGASGAIAAGLAPLMAQAIGFKAILVTVIVLYAVVAIISRRFSGISVSPPAHA